MKILVGHYCSRCRAVVLERRRKPPPFCPACKADNSDNSAIEPSLVTVLKLDKEDFPKKPKDLPGQTYLFNEDGSVILPAATGGLF